MFLHKRREYIRRDSMVFLIA